MNYNVSKRERSLIVSKMHMVPMWTFGRRSGVKGLGVVTVGVFSVSENRIFVFPEG